MKNCEVRGGDFCKFYKRPLKSGYKPNDVILEPDEEIDFIAYHSYPKIIAKFVSKGVQTDYRENETQTDPWDPPYKISAIQGDPEVLSLKSLSYGNGLPASLLEVNYIKEARKYKSTKTEFENIDSNDTFEKRKQVIRDQVKNEWNYKIAVENQKLLQKLSHMKTTVIKDLKEHSEKREKILMNTWAHRKDEMSKKNVKLERKLQKELLVVESDFRTEKSDKYEKDKNDIEVSRGKKIKKDPEEIEYMLSSYFLSNPTGLSNVKNWLEKKADGLTTNIPLLRKTKIAPRERLAEKAYKSILDKKCTKLPPKIYRKDYVKEETSPPPQLVEDTLESFDLEEEKIDMVTVLQQTLRGLAYQKQMLELVERHKDGLSTILHFATGVSSSL